MLFAMTQTLSSNITYILSTNLNSTYSFDTYQMLFLGIGVSFPYVCIVFMIEYQKFNKNKIKLLYNLPRIIILIFKIGI